MQLPIPWRTGQAKPFGSIPRVNLAHPLAKGLVGYAYDLGGTIIDLVNGGAGVVTSSTTHSTVKTSRYGTAFNYGGTITSDAVTLPLTKRLATLGLTAPFSFASGLFNTAAPVNNNTAVALAQSNASTSVFIASGTNVGPAFVVGFNDGNTQFTSANGTNALNVYHVVVTSVATATTGSFYVDGKLDQALSGTLTDSGITSMQICFNTQTAGAIANGGGIKGPAFWVGCWNRALTAAEALQLYQDPYCFLIYPEDEIFAMLVGAAAAPTGLPDAPAERIPWILPGLGPASRHVSLLNAALPVPPAVQPVTGGTLPLMGVG